MLEQVAGNEKGKILTIGKVHVSDMLTKTVMPKLVDDHLENLKICLEEFNKALGMANKKEYFKDKKMQETIATAANVLAESYLNRGFKPVNPDEFCHKQTVSFLESYTTYILAHMEILAAMREKENANKSQA